MTKGIHITMKRMFCWIPHIKFCKVSKFQVCNLNGYFFIVSSVCYTFLLFLPYCQIALLTVLCGGNTVFFMEVSEFALLCHIFMISFFRTKVFQNLGWFDLRIIDSISISFLLLQDYIWFLTCLKPASSVIQC